MSFIMAGYLWILIVDYLGIFGDIDFLVLDVMFDNPKISESYFFSYY